MLRYRLILGALLIAGFAALCWCDRTGALGAAPGEWLFPLAVVLSVLASGEIVGLLQGCGLNPSRWLVYIGNFLIVAANGIPMFVHRHNFVGEFAWPLCTFMVVVLASFVCAIFRYREPGSSVKQIAATVLAVAYVGLLLSFVVLLPGMLALISLITVVKMGDTGAYTVGRIFGKHKMAPHLSPGKTWEGAAGAMLFGVIGGWAIFTWLAPAMRGSTAEPVQIWQWIVYGIIVAITGLLGDLAESLLKRDAGRKDSSTWMPGFGGVLDVLDSILFAAPVAYLCWASGLVH